MGGNGLIKQAWEKRGKPLNEGWNITLEELQAFRFSEPASAAKRLTIDFDPKANWRIGLVEPEVIYAYTYGNKQGLPTWTPLMLKLRNVFYNDIYDGALTKEKKDALLAEGIVQNSEEECIEFLYLQGTSWNWGRNGSTNAAFIEAGAREYFRPFF